MRTWSDQVLRQRCMSLLHHLIKQTSGCVSSDHVHLSMSVACHVRFGGSAGPAGEDRASRRLDVDSRGLPRRVSDDVWSAQTSRQALESAAVFIPAMVSCMPACCTSDGLGVCMRCVLAPSRTRKQVCVLQFHRSKVVRSVCSIWISGTMTACVTGARARLRRRARAVRARCCPRTTRPSSGATASTRMRSVLSGCAPHPDPPLFSESLAELGSDIGLRVGLGL